MENTALKKEKTGFNPITEGRIGREMILFFLPLMFGTFFQLLYNTADSVIVGQFVGKEALAAVGERQFHRIFVTGLRFFRVSRSAGSAVAEFDGLIHHGPSTGEEQIAEVGEKTRPIFRCGFLLAARRRGGNRPDSINLSAKTR